MSKLTATALTEQLATDSVELRDFFREKGRDFAQRIDRLRATADDFARRKKAERRPSRENLKVVKP